MPPYSERIGKRLFDIRMKARPNLGTMNERAKMRRLSHGAAETPFLRCTPPNKAMLVSLPRALYLTSTIGWIERDGSVRSHHVPNVSAKTLPPISQAQIYVDTTVMSDDGGARVGKDFARHETVKLIRRYAVTNAAVHDSRQPG